MRLSLSEMKCVITACCLSMVSVMWADCGSTTNTGGWQMALSTKTNRFVEGEQIGASLVVSNTTSKVGYLSWSWKPSTCPGFGQLQIADVATGKRIPFSGSGTNWLDGKGGNWIDDRGGSFGPTDSIAFDFDLRRHYQLSRAGDYLVGFTGHVQSLTRSNEVLGFTIPPISIHVAPARKK